MPGEIERTRSVSLDMPGGDCFTFSEAEGLIEIAVSLGSPVRKGEVLARVFPANRTGLAPVEYRARTDGMLVARHFPGLVKTGDCAAVIAVPQD
jgi:N-alpha-acetyl-L-2,4-diaminobutyrate deacetylase